ncbi:hypothetical protein [Microbacterium sp. B19]|uniref:hypothetical protein n=1 Tax=Microbacterium sp. B19 TaxID=96765 RepID=UPI00034C04FF|nr:hypothetical protein [Microbacterium sp. B19]
MAYLIALGILSLIGIVSTAWLLYTDGYGRVPTDPRGLPGGAERTAPEPPAAKAAATRTADARAAEGRTPAAPVARRQRRAARA